ncbi:MAG: winged helix-turn-helix transcriptional regulator [Thermoplasmata archaeon]
MRKAVMVCAWLMEHEKTTQSEISEEMDMSLSTVNRTVKKLEKMGAVEIHSRRLKTLDKEKILMYMSSIRDTEKDIVYRTRVNEKVREIERSMPGGVEFTAYTAYRFRYGDIPADYSEVYVYADEQGIGEIKKRFQKTKGPPNLFVLKNEMKVNDALIFADLWNLREWYAKEFTREMYDRILE